MMNGAGQAKAVSTAGSFVSGWFARRRDAFGSRIRLPGPPGARLSLALGKVRLEFGGLPRPARLLRLIALFRPTHRTRLPLATLTFQARKLRLLPRKSNIE